MESGTDIDLKQILTQQSANPLLKHVHADPELDDLCTKVGQGISDLLEIIKTETLAPATVSRLQMVIVDGGALLASCVASVSADAVPPAVLSSIEGWRSWVGRLSVDMAARKDEQQKD